VEILERHYAALDRELGGRELFLEAFSLVDIALAPHLLSAAFLGHAPGEDHPGLSAWLERIRKRPSIRQATREMAAAFTQAQSDEDPIFDVKRLHFRSDRIECAIRCGLGPWLLDELSQDRVFLSPLP
jgi:hypothetical protein